MVILKKDYKILMKTLPDFTFLNCVVIAKLSTLSWSQLPHLGNKTLWITRILIKIQWDNIRKTHIREMPGNASHTGNSQKTSAIIKIKLSILHLNCPRISGGGMFASLEFLWFPVSHLVGYTLKNLTTSSAHAIHRTGRYLRGECECFITYLV